MAPTDEGGVTRLAEALTVGNEDMSAQAAAEAAAEALDAFYHSSGMPARVRDLHIPEEELPLLAQDTLKNFNANPGERGPGYVDEMLEMLRAFW